MLCDHHGHDVELKVKKCIITGTPEEYKEFNSKDEARLHLWKYLVGKRMQIVHADKVYLLTPQGSTIEKPVEIIVAEWAVETLPPLGEP